MLFVDAGNNRVGINASSPAKDLHIKRASGETTLRLDSGGSYSDIIQNGVNLFIQNAAGGGNIIFYDDAAERMRIDSDGNVGIGTNEPTDILTVVGSISGSGVLKNVGAAKFGASVFVTGSVTAGTSFIIGSADLNETDLEKLDGITDGTAVANKAVVVDGSKNIATLGTVGCGAITSTGTSTFANVSGSGTLKAGTDVTFEGLASGSAAGPGSYVSVDSGGKLVLTESAGGGGVSFNGSTANGVVTYGGATQADVEANMTFDGTTLTVTGDSSLDGGVTINDAGADKDFRVESVDESHMIFVEGSSNRVSIGDNTGSPGATLEVKNNASAGAFGVPLVQLNSNDTDQQCLDINASNITANVVNITANDVTTARVLAIGADGLTTGNAVHVDDNSPDTGTRNTALIIQNHTGAIAATALTVQSDGGITGVKLDKNFSDTTAATVTGLNIDFDKTGTSTSNNTMYGLNIDMDNTTATNGTNTMYGIHCTPTLTHAADAGISYLFGALVNAQAGSNGTSLVRAARFEAGGGDINYGIQVDCEDGGVDLRIESSADSGDYFQIQTTTHGATTITTFDDDAAAADLTFNVDGDITLDPVGGDVFVDANISGSGLFKVVGAAQFGSSIAATGSVTTKSHLIVSGNTYLGTGAPDSVTIVGLTTASLGGPGSYLGVNAANQLVLTESAGGSSPIATYNTAGDNRVITSVNSDTVQGEANFTFSGTRLEVTGAAVINGELRGKQVHVTHHAWTGTSTNNTYIPFYDLSEHSSTSPGYRVGMIAPFNGRLLKVMFRPQTGQSAAVTVGVHTGSNTESGVDTTAIETITITPVDAGYTTSVYNFTALSHFTAESFIGVSINPNNSTNACTAICVWEFDTTTI